MTAAKALQKSVTVLLMLWLLSLWLLFIAYDAGRNADDVRNCEVHMRGTLP